MESPFAQSRAQSPLPIHLNNQYCLLLLGPLCRRLRRVRQICNSRNSIYVYGEKIRKKKRYTFNEYMYNYTFSVVQGMESNLYIQTPMSM